MGLDSSQRPNLSVSDCFLLWVSRRVIIRCIHARLQYVHIHRTNLQRLVSPRHHFYRPLQPPIPQAAITGLVTPTSPAIISAPAASALARFASLNLSVSSFFHASCRATLAGTIALLASVFL